MKNLLFPICLAVLFFSCGSEKKQTKLSFQQRQINKLLNETTIFKIDTVTAVIKAITPDQITKAKQLFMQGLDLFVNKKNATESIKLFKESIMYNPLSKTYLYLANASADAGDTVTGMNAVDLTYQIGYEPENEILYTQARLSAATNNKYDAMQHLREALNSGFINKKRLMSDKCFDGMKEDREFQAMLVSYFSDEGKLRASLFKNFVKEFPEAGYPLVIDKAYLRFGNGPDINYDYAHFIPGMEDSRFSRDVSNEYKIVGTYTVNANVIAIVYKTITAIVDTLQPCNVQIATYDSLGNMTENITLAEFTLPATLTTGSIVENGTITIKEYAIKWKKDPNEEGYDGNEWLGEELQKEKTYKINPDGKFELLKTETAKSSSEVAKQ